MNDQNQQLANENTRLRRQLMDVSNLNRVSSRKEDTKSAELLKRETEHILHQWREEVLILTHISFFFTLLCNFS